MELEKDNIQDKNKMVGKINNYMEKWTRGPQGQEVLAQRMLFMGVLAMQEEIFRGLTMGMYSKLGRLQDPQLLRVLQEGPLYG